MMNMNCWNNDHTWDGGGACICCGTRLRCGCGRFIAERDLDEHIATSCPLTLAAGEAS